MTWLTFLTPWEPLWWLIALFALTLAVYLRGLWRCRRTVNPWAVLGFLLGLLSMYVVMQTRFDYYSQHMFFIHRIQHLVLHHLGPFLIALSAPAGLLTAGSPRWLRALGRRTMAIPPVRITYHTLQQPVVAGLVFVGLIGFWLIPSVHFDAMLGVRDYWLMNLSMAVDGLLFWWVMFDPRAPGTTPTTHGFGLRIAVLCAVILPQIVIGATIALDPSTVYDVYAVCGRAWAVSPLVDQQIGGLITWIPPAMMSVVGTLVLIRFYIRVERRHPLPAPHLTSTATA